MQHVAGAEPGVDHQHPVGAGRELPPGQRRGGRREDPRAVLHHADRGPVEAGQGAGRADAVRGRQLGGPVPGVVLVGQRVDGGEGASREGVRVGVGLGHVAPRPGPEHARALRRIDRGHPAHPVRLGLRKADPEVQAQRLGYLLRQDGAQCASGRPQHQLGQQPAVGLRVVAVPGARLPEGLLRGDRVRSGDSVAGLGGGQPPVQRREARTVGEQVADQGLLLAARLELRPVRADRRVQVEQPALVQQQRHGRGHALGRGADDLRGVLGPGLGAVGVLGAAPQVDDLAAVAVDGHGRAPVAEHLEVAYERVPDGLEALRHHTLDVHEQSNNRRPALMPP